jgi:hypothetical protein
MEELLLIEAAAGRDGVFRHVMESLGPRFMSIVATGGVSFPKAASGPDGVGVGVGVTGNPRTWPEVLVDDQLGEFERLANLGKSKEGSRARPGSTWARSPF